MSRTLNTTGGPDRTRARQPREAATVHKAAITLRLDAAVFQRLKLVAAEENRTPTNLVETVLLRELRARDEARRVLTVAIAPELAGVEAGELIRGENEDDAEYARRQAVFSELLAVSDAG